MSHDKFRNMSRYILRKTTFLIPPLAYIKYISIKKEANRHGSYHDSTTNSMELGETPR